MSKKLSKLAEELQKKEEESTKQQRLLLIEEKTQRINAHLDALEIRRINCLGVLCDIEKNIRDYPASKIVDADGKEKSDFFEVLKNDLLGIYGSISKRNKGYMLQLTSVQGEYNQLLGRKPKEEDGGSDNMDGDNGVSGAISDGPAPESGTESAPDLGSDSGKGEGESSS